MSCCNSNCNHDPCGSSFNQKLTMAAQYAQYAQTQANKAESLWEEFNALYLGAFAVAPTQDNQGNPLQVGALYWNTGASELYAWNGLAWVTATGFNEFTPFLATGSTTPRNLATRMADVVNVKDFGAVGDGATDDINAIENAINYLKSRGGGGLFFPGKHLISRTLYLDGSITGGVSSYPVPALPKITFIGNGESGIVSNITSGDVIRLSSSPSNLLYWKLGIKDFTIDCLQNEVTAINGQSFNGSNGSGRNNYVDFDGLVILGCSGINSIGIDFGSITDSNIQRTWVQFEGVGGIAYKINKINVDFTDSFAVYASKAFWIGNLTEAQFNIKGGGAIMCATDLYIGSDFTFSGASVIEGAFLGEHLAGQKIIDRVSNSSLDINSLTFIGCQFDTANTLDHLMTLDFGGRFTFIGNNVYNSTTGFPTTVNAGQFANVWFYNNTNMSIWQSSDALLFDQVNTVPSKSYLNFYKNGLTSGTTSVLMDASQSTILTQKMAYSGSIVAISGQSSSAITIGGAALTVKKNGVDTSVSALIPNGSSSGYATFRRGQITFVAGDTISVNLYASNPIAPSPIDFSCLVTIET